MALPSNPFFWEKKSKGKHGKKARVLFFSSRNPLNPWNRKEKRPKKGRKIGKQKKQGNREKKSRIGGSGASSWNCQNSQVWCTSNFGIRLGGSLAPKRVSKPMVFKWQVLETFKTCNFGAPAIWYPFGGWIRFLLPSFTHHQSTLIHSDLFRFPCFLPICSDFRSILVFGNTPIFCSDCSDFFHFVFRTNQGNPFLQTPFASPRNQKLEIKKSSFGNDFRAGTSPAQTTEMGSVKTLLLKDMRWSEFSWQSGTNHRNDSAREFSGVDQPSHRNKAKHLREQRQRIVRTIRGGCRSLSSKTKGLEANRTRKFTRTFGKIFVTQFLCGTFSVPKWWVRLLISDFLTLSMMALFFWWAKGRRPLGQPKRCTIHSKGNWGTRSQKVLRRPVPKGPRRTKSTTQ